MDAIRLTSISTSPFKFNPYTGMPRDPRDIAFDPRGLLIVPAEDCRETLAAKPASSQKRILLSDNIIPCFDVDAT